MSKIAKTIKAVRAATAAYLSATKQYDVQPEHAFSKQSVETQRAVQAAAAEQSDSQKARETKPTTFPGKAA